MKKRDFQVNGKFFLIKREFLVVINYFNCKIQERAT